MKQIDELKKFCDSYNKIYIYGAGAIARKLSSIMKSIQCEYDSYIVSRKGDNVSFLYGHPVHEVMDIDLAADGIGIILAISEENQKDIRDTLDRIKFKNYFCYQCDLSFHKDILPILSLRERCKFLEESIRNGKHVVVLISDSISFNNTNWRYRAYNIYEVMLKYSIKWSYMFFSETEIKMIIPFLNKVDVVTFLRMQWTFEIDEFIKHAKNEKVTILYSIDDLVFNSMHAVRILENSTSTCTMKMYNDIFGKIARNRMIMDKADGFLSTNTCLKMCLERDFHKPCKIIRNFLNEEQIGLSKVQAPSYSLERDVFIIGYFSGTFTHQKDFSCCSFALSRLMEKYKDIKLRIVGYIKIPQELERYQQMGRIEEIPQVDFLTLQKLIGEVDVNLAPLVVDEFTNSKSELKFFEAAIMSVVTCASPTIAFQECITNGENGFLCENETEWYLNLQCLYLDFNRRKKMATNARKYAVENYTGEKVVAMIEAAYEYWD
jgi:glycosyltransferase involved in cell wall biosynthesis